MDSSDRKLEIRGEITKLIQEYAEITNVERMDGTHEPVYVSGWVTFAEFESTSMMIEECTASLSIYQPGQSRAMSRGLHEFGVDVYSV